MSLKKLGRYDLIRVLGKGAMGLVYEGRDPNLDRRVAIKTIKVENLSEEDEAEYEVRFRTEARSAARLQHPNIVSVYDSDRDVEIAFLVMEFIQGDDLKHHLDNGELYSLAQTVGIMADLLSALDYAHQQGIVHRDIKPANLLIEASGRVKLTDFGVARIQGSGEATRTQGSMVGTLKYMSPEQVQGRPIDARADLFAAGIVLYQLLTGKRPFDGDNDFDIIQKIVGQAPVAPSVYSPNLPPAVDKVVARALEKSRDLRFATAQEFSVALHAAVQDALDPAVLPPANALAYGRNSTWTATVLKSEIISETQPGSRSGTSTSTVTQEVELVYWKDVKDSDDADDLSGFLGKFPSGIYADLARRRLKKLGTLPGTGMGMDTDFQSEPTRLEPRKTDSAWAELQATAVQTVPLVPPKAAPLQEDPDATRLGAPAVAATVAAPATPAPAPEGIQNTAAQDTADTQPPTAAKPKPVGWILAGVLAVVAVGLGLQFGGGPAADSAGVPVAAAPALASSAPVQPMVPASAPASAPLAAPLPVKAATAKPKTSEPKVLAAPTPPVPAATSTAVVKPDTAKVSTSDKKSQSPPSQALTKPSGVPAVSANPSAACEGRWYLSFQICMSQQCANPEFAKHPVCVERHAQEQNNREAEQLRSNNRK